MGSQTGKKDKNQKKFSRNDKKIFYENEAKTGQNRQKLAKNLLKLTLGGGNCDNYVKMSHVFVIKTC